VPVRRRRAAADDAYRPADDLGRAGGGQRRGQRRL